jgi:hypothetical protein
MTVVFHTQSQENAMTTIRKMLIFAPIILAFVGGLIIATNNKQVIRKTGIVTEVSFPHVNDDKGCMICVDLDNGYRILLKEPIGPIQSMVPGWHIEIFGGDLVDQGKFPIYANTKILKN